MNTIDPAFSSFADAYSDAVTSFIHSGRSHAVFYDARSNRFVAEPVVDGTAPTDVDVWIGQTWEQAFPDLDCATNKADGEYSSGALKSAVAKRVLMSRWAFQIFEHMQNSVKT